jgi:outer membrane protein
MRTLFIIIIVISVNSHTQGQSILDDYISEGLTNNIVLQQKNIALDQALLGLKMAKGSFLPSVNLQGSYTSGKGGRSIDIPIGDLLNPVYATLNNLTTSDAFPQVENVSQDFFPYDFYDARVRTTLPIYNTRLKYNRRISEQQIEMKSYELETYKRELVRNIKTAYFNYLSAREALRIYENALLLALESQRVNESLLKNGKGLPAYVIRSESEVQSVKAKMAEASQQELMAKRYFNFLLNRELDHSIDAGTVAQEQITFNGTDNTPATNRPELHQLRQAVLINESILKMNRAYRTPQVSGYLDLGSQEQNWQFNNQSRYYLFGIQVDIPLFTGMTNHYKIEQSENELRSIMLTQNNLEQSIRMSISNSQGALEAAIQNHESARKQEAAARSYQKLIEKGYKEGVHSFIESVDARNQLTNAQLQTTITQYTVLIAMADYEHETSSYAFEN